MLSKLLKYEFRSTARTMGGLYLALLAAAGLLGLTMRFGVSDTRLGADNYGNTTAGVGVFAAVLMLVYMALIIATLVLTFVSVIQRFHKNLLGGEGYLMHTLPVSTRALVGSKLIASLVWCVISMLVEVLSMLLVSLVIWLNMDELKFLPDAAAQMLREFRLVSGLNALSFFAGVLVTLLCGFGCSVLCIYAACMIGHQFKRHMVPAGVVSYFVLQFVQSTLLSRLGINGSGLVDKIADGVFRAASGYESLPVNGQFWLGVLGISLPSLVFALIYFFLTDWLLREHLNLE